LGLQGNLWSEYLYQPNQFDYQLFPRALAVAETGWTHPDLKNLKDFIRRIDEQQIRLDEHQIDYYIPTPEGNLNHMEFADSLRLGFTTNRPVQVVYTEDGSTPTQNSKTYTRPIVVTKTTTLKLCSVLPQGKMSPVRTIHLVKTEPIPSIHAVHLQQGLRLKYTSEGYYKYVSQLESVKNWQDTVISLPNQLFKLIPVYNDGKSIAGEPQGAGIISGYLQVDKAGLYQVHCNADELRIGNQLLINNDGKIKKSVPTDITVPLEAGYYPIQMTILNNVWGGFPSSWADFRIQLREWKGDKNSAKLSPVNVYYRK
jgi:hexosaminidase